MLQDNNEIFHNFGDPAPSLSHHSLLFPHARKILSSVIFPSFFFENNRYTEHDFPSYHGPTLELYTSPGHIFPPYTPSENSLPRRIPWVGTSHAFRCPASAAVKSRRDQLQAVTLSSCPRPAPL